MREKLATIKVNLNFLIKRVYDLKFDENVNYEVEQKLNEVNHKIYELSDLIEQIQAMVEL